MVNKEKPNASTPQTKNKPTTMENLTKGRPMGKPTDQTERKEQIKMRPKEKMEKQNGKTNMKHETNYG